MTWVGYSAVILFTIAMSVSSFFAFPYLEGLYTKTSADYLVWVMLMNEKMFRPTAAKKIASLILLSTITFFLFGYFLSHGLGVLTWGITLLFGFVGWSLPRWWISYQWKNRLQRFDLQLIDALNLMANSLKSGLNLPQAIQVLVQEMPPPISQEFGLVMTQQKLGVTLEEALEKMAERVPSQDLGIVVHAILILRETGGDLTETFDVIASTIRERRKVDGRIKTLTATVRTQAFLLMLLPIGLVGLMYLVNPGFLNPLFTTQIGWMILAAAIALQVLGGLWLRKIVRIEV